MVIYTHSTRNGEDFYTSYTGMSQETVSILLSDLGCTDISFIIQQEFLESLSKPFLGE